MNSCWKEIEGRILNAVSGIVFSQYGGVCFGVDYLENEDKIWLRVYDKPMRYEDKELIVDEKFDYKFKNDICTDIHDIVLMVEKYLFSL